jgi:protein tyrosine phosphatase (PTP) superfamily phosphohydrolase (DUF442 family)
MKLSARYVSPPMPNGLTDTSVQPLPASAVTRRSRTRRRWLVGGSVLCLCAAAVVGWYAGLRNRFEPMNFGVVEPGRIFRSGQISKQVMRQTLVNNGIRVIIDLSSRWEETPDARAERAIAKQLGIERINLTLRGNGVGDPNVYPQVLADIVKANHDGKAVLVHCQSGAQRTGGIVAAYRILVEGRSEDAAFAEMGEYGHRPHSNPELIPFIKSHLPEWRAKLAAEHIISTTGPASIESIGTAISVSALFQRTS